jgi:excisionase family DNA binding protein
MSSHKFTREKPAGGDKPRFIRVMDVARRLGVSRSTALRLLRNRELPAVKMGGVLLVPEAEFEAQLQWMVSKAAEACAAQTDKRPDGAGR